MKIGKYQINENTLNVMAILNVTPDSFSDGGSYRNLDETLFRVQEMIEEGAAIIDVGGESTRPGYTLISDEEEISRTAPVIEAIKARFDIPISLDTYKSGVAACGIKAGADFINDIWGLQYDKALGDLVRDSKASYCLMHNRKEINESMGILEYLDQIKEDINRAKAYGIEDDKIILDPGVGFAKTKPQDLMCIANLKLIKSFGYPVLLGASRKSVINSVINKPVDKRLAGTLATTVYAFEQGASFVRVHDIKENVDLIKMLIALESKREELNYE